jgi:hypothetical protein
MVFEFGSVWKQNRKIAKALMIYNSYGTVDKGYTNDLKLMLLWLFRGGIAQGVPNTATNSEIL